MNKCFAFIVLILYLIFITKNVKDVAGREGATSAK